VRHESHPSSRWSRRIDFNACKPHADKFLAEVSEYDCAVAGRNGEANCKITLVNPHSNYPPQRPRERECASAVVDRDSIRANVSACARRRNKRHNREHKEPATPGSQHSRFTDLLKASRPSRAERVEAAGIEPAQRFYRLPRSSEIAI
jgi:hypothetical protein